MFNHRNVFTSNCAIHLQDSAGVIYQHLPVLVKSLSDILCRSGHDDQQDCPVEFKVNICVLLKTLADEFNILSSEVPQELVEYLKNSSSLNVPVQGDDACSTAAPHEQNRPIPPQNMLAIVSKALLNSLQQSHA